MNDLFKKKLAVYFFGGILVCFLAVIGFVYSQLKDLDNIKVMVVEKIEELTGSNVSIDTAELEYEGGVSVRLRNLSIKSIGGESHETFVKSAWCVVRLWPLLEQKIEIKKLILQGASIELVRDKQGKLNYGNSSRWHTVATGREFFDALGVSFMRRISLSNSKLRFLDYYGVSDSDPFSIAIKNINLNIDKRFFKNILSFNLSAEIPNTHQPTIFQLSGSIDNLLKEKGGRQSPIQGTVKLDQLHIAKFWPYLKNLLPAKLHDAWFSLGTGFSGDLEGNLHSDGRLQYSIASPEQKPILGGRDSSKSGIINYSFSFDKDSIKVQDFKLRSGPLNFSAVGKLAGLKSQNPKVSFTVQTGEIKIEKTRQYLPLMFFSESVHRDLNRRFNNGTLQIKSLNFDGSLEQLKKLDLEKNKTLFDAEIVFKKVDWRSPLPLLKKVTGSLQYKNGNGSFEIINGKFKDLPIANLRGAVHSIMNSPVADISFENEIQMKELNHVLKKAIKGESFEDILDDYENVSGKGFLKVKLQGPLEELAKAAITGVLSVKDVSFYDTELKSRVKNFNGEILYRHTSEEEQMQSGLPVPIITFKNLSGDFGKSSFYNMQGEILRKGKNTVRKMNAMYRLNVDALPNIIGDIDFSGPLFAMIKQADFKEGDLEINYRNFIDFKKPKQEKAWGKIELKNVSVSHPSGFQPLLKLVGGISFGDGRIGLEKISGWYGSSPIQVDGQLTLKSKSLVNFDLHASSTDWKQADFKDIPHLQDLKFTGPISAEIKLLGDRNSFRFKNKLDLTRVSYKFQNDLHKKRNVNNDVEINGIYSEKEGIVIDQLKFVLDKNSITGKAKINSFADPTYSVRINAVGFEANTLGSLMDVFSNNTDGKIDFNILSEGKLNQSEGPLFKGSAVLKDLIFKWEDRKNPLTLSADVRFSGNTYDLRFGRMESGRSKIAFRGKYKNEEQPELVLKLTGETLIVDELISNKKDEDKDEVNLKDLFDTSHLLSHGKSKISVNLKQLDYKWLTLGDVSGTFLLKDKEIIFDGFRIGPNNAIKGQGKFSVKDPESIRFETRMKADEIQTKDFLAMFGGHFNEGLTGKFKKLKLILKSRGRKLSENIRTLNGKLSFDLASGVIDTKKLYEGVFSLFDLERPLETENKKEKDQEPSEYESISGDFVYIGGVAETNNFVYETSQRKSAIVGKFDLNVLEMDTVVGVAHLPGLDKLLNQIPVVGSILTAGDEGSLIKTYYDVKGPFDNPEVTAVPFTSVGKKFLGLFQGILQTSEEILSLPEKMGVGKIPD